MLANGRSLFPIAAGDALFPAPMQILSVATDFEPGHVDQFNVGVQQQIGSRLSVQAGYVGGRGRDLMGDGQINMPVFGPGATLANAQQRRPLLPQFYGSISEKVASQRSRYDSLQAQRDEGVCERLHLSGRVHAVAIDGRRVGPGRDRIAGSR